MDPPASPTRDRRHLAFLTVAATLTVAALILTLLGPGNTPQEVGVAAARADSSSEQTRGAAVPTSDAPAPPKTTPAYLAWTPGGLPSDFRARVRTVHGLEATVVFAGDTLWLTGSRDASDEVVDDPRPPYAFPIDAFAVNPIEVAPFLPSEVRRTVGEALAQGRAVLGTRSAALRRLGVGGTLEFGERGVRIGAVVPDELIGWSEMLVSRELGERLGILDDRYLLALPRGKPGLAAFERMLRPLVPSTLPMRVERPGATPYMRVANGVDPPIVLKEVFGEFSAALEVADPAFFRVDPAWTDHLVTRSVPLLGRLTCHRRFMADLLVVMRTVEREGLGSLIHSTAGCFNARTVGRSPSNPPSFHAYGAAVDINAPENAFGAAPTMDRRIVAIFEAAGFNWGGDFLIPDGMHFEYGGGPPQTRRGGTREPVEERPPRHGPSSSGRRTECRLARPEPGSLGGRAPFPTRRPLPRPRLGSRGRCGRGARAGRYGHGGARIERRRTTRRPHGRAGRQPGPIVSLRPATARAGAGLGRHEAPGQR
jgi:hypothetical protein